MEYSRNTKPYQIIIDKDRYLLECYDERYSEHHEDPENLEVRSYEEFLEDIVDREMSFIRVHTNQFGGYWDCNFSWAEFLYDICDSNEILEDLDADDGGDHWLQIKFEMPWNKTYYYVDYRSLAQGDSGQRINSTRQDKWCF